MAEPTATRGPVKRGLRFTGARGRRFPWGTLPALILIAVVLVYPLVLGISRSITERDGGVSAYAWFFDNEVYLRILLRTFTTAASVTAICLALGYPYAYLMTIVRPRTRALLIVVVLLPFWTSSLVRVFAWVILLQPHGVVSTALSPLGVGERLLGTQAAVLIGMSQLLLPFLVIPVYNTMRGIDPRLLRAAESLGARPAVAFWRVFAPLSLPGVRAGSLLVFVLALGFYVVPALLGSPAQSLIAQTIFQQVSSLLYFGRGGALAVFVLALTALLALLLATPRLLVRGRSRR